MHDTPAVERIKERKKSNMANDVVDEIRLGETAMTGVVTNNEPL